MYQVCEKVSHTDVSGMLNNGVGAVDEMRCMDESLEKCHMKQLPRFIEKNNCVLLRIWENAVTKPTSPLSDFSRYFLTKCNILMCCCFQFAPEFV